MSLTFSRPLRLGAVLLAAQLVLACGGGGGQPPPADLTPPTTVANPAGGAFNSPRSVTLTCDDGSGSGCAATHYTLDGSVPTQASPRYTAPLGVSASASLRFFSVDRVGNLEAVQQLRFVVDTEAPQVAAAPRGGSFSTSRAVTLTCDDGEGSGCAAIHYTTNGSLPTLDSPVYQEPLLLTATTRVRFIAVDWVGNVSEVVSEQYTRDTTVEDRTAPVTTASPAGGVYESVQSVVLSCTDDAQGSGCEATYYTVDGSAPSAASQRYSGPITVAATTTLRFFSRDLVGNDEVAKTEQYTLDTTPPVTTASPAGGVFQDAVAVTLACSDSLSGCAETRYTLDGSAPTASSPRYEGPITLTRAVTLRFASTDQVGNVELAREASYELPDLDRQASQQIQAVRTASNGSVNLVIHGAWVTYIKEGVGNLANDPAGLFLQAERTGPAVFVPVDPSTLTTVPRVGDRVRVTVNAKSVVNGQTRASIASLDVLSRGHLVSSLLQEVSEVDLTSGGTRPDHESEYIAVYGTIRAPGFSGSGPGHLQAPFTTLGVPEGSTSASSLRLRVVESVSDSLALSAGCDVWVTSPLWVFMSSAQTRPHIQVSAWREHDVRVNSCPAPLLLEAWAPDRNTVMVRFNRPMDPASIIANGSQFSIPGLSVTQAQLSESSSVIALTTANQGHRQNYTLTVANSLRDGRGVPLNSTFIQVSFRGFPG